MIRAESPQGMALSGPLVSVCIPVYNHQDFVRDAVQSIIGQDYQHIELIVIDDGSRDGSAAAVEQLVGACRARFARFEFIKRENRGVGATLNQSIDWSRGKYFSAVASDDLMLPAKTSLLVEHLERNPGLGAAFGQIELIDIHGAGKSSPPCLPRVLSFDEMLTRLGGPPAPAQLIRMDALRAVGKYRPDVVIEDLYMWLAIAAAGYGLEIIPPTVARYRDHGGNTSKNMRKMLEGRLQIVDLYRQSACYEHARSNAFLMTAHESLNISRRESLSFFLSAVRENKRVLLQRPGLDYIVRMLTSARVGRALG
jgi:alpha-1,3-rhamnosyltransferase